MVDNEHPDRIELQHELILRGLRDLAEEGGVSREYAEAFDAFIEANDCGGRIGDQPENVQELYYDIAHEVIGVRDAAE